jgi:hypothetical protein
MTSDFLTTRRTLYFVHARGCSACEEAEPELALFEHARPGLMIIRLDANYGIAQRLGIGVKVTPTYVLRLGDTGVRHEGALTAKELADWVDSSIGRIENGEQEPAEPDEEPDEGSDDEDEDDAEGDAA